MIQTFRSSSQYWSLQHLRPEKGFQAWPESATKHTKILYQNKENIYTRLCSHINILDSTDIFRSSCNQQRTYRDQLVQTFRTTSNGEFVIEPNDDKKVTPQSNLWAKWDAFYRFCQLYTATGVINKPYFPLASGELSMRQGKAITSAFGLMCLAMGIMCKSPPLFIGILVLFLLGTAYSVELPYLRWKTNPYLAAICIVSAQGFTTPPTVFCHIQHVLGKPVAFTKSFRFATIFFSLFALVLALFKDIPDVEGDRAFGNQTFSVRHGKKKVFSLCVSILVIAYGYALVIGASSSVLICKIVSVIGHLTLAALLLFRAKSVNLDDNESTQSFYKLLWKMLCAEYILIHLIR
ncbi:umbelliferone 6-dimethylallyltransferase, chloroplastic-like isoform X4 [Daucus carota subsp. sativus]|uniref:umbelliferone 6-dimethylallyltransferase, chloroplastic-like isoform X4 n=1 Tax=Daucus carota subsp. sativus TaxID=79200 RepID=UPI0030827209